MVTSVRTLERVTDSNDGAEALTDQGGDPKKSSRATPSAPVRAPNGSGSPVFTSTVARGIGRWLWSSTVTRSETVGVAPVS